MPPRALAGASAGVAISPRTLRPPVPRLPAVPADGDDLPLPSVSRHPSKSDRSCPARSAAGRADPRESASRPAGDTWPRPPVLDRLAARRHTVDDAGGRAANRQPRGARRVVRGARGATPVEPPPRPARLARARGARPPPDSALARRRGALCNAPLERAPVRFDNLAACCASRRDRTSAFALRPRLQRSASVRRRARPVELRLSAAAAEPPQPPVPSRREARHRPRLGRPHLSAGGARSYRRSGPAPPDCPAGPSRPHVAPWRRTSATRPMNDQPNRRIHRQLELIPLILQGTRGVGLAFPFAPPGFVTVSYWFDDQACFLESPGRLH